MKILRNFVVTGGLLRSNGDQAQVGDTVRLYPYEGEPFLATIEAVAPVNCGQDRAYAIEYDLDVVLRVCDLQDRGDVLDCCGLLNERVEVLERGNVLVFGAVADGVTDNTEAFQSAIDAGNIYIPAGNYSFDGHLVVPSNRIIQGENGSFMRRADDTVQPGEPVLLTNSDPENGNENITIEGGIWDFNGHNNTRVDTAYQPQTGFRFKRVQNLQILDTTLKDPLRFSTLLTLCTDGFINNITFVQEPRSENGDGIHCNGCQGMTVTNLRGNCGDDMLNFATGDSQYWQDGLDGHGDNVNNTAIGIHATSGSSAFRVLSMNGDIADRIYIGNVSGNFDGIVGWISDAVGQPGPDYRGITIENIFAGRQNTADQTTAQPVLSTTAAIRNLIIRNVSRPSDDTKDVPLIALGDQYGGRFGNVEISGVEETSTVRRHVVDVYSGIDRLVINGVLVKQPSSGASAQMVNVRSGVSIDKLSMSDCHADGLDTLVNFSDASADLEMVNCSANNCYAAVAITVGSTVSYSLSNVTTGPSTIIATVFVSASQVVLGTQSSCRAALGGAFMSITGTGTGDHRFLSFGSAGSFGWADATNNVSLNSMDFNVDHTKLVPFDGDVVKGTTGQIYNRVSGSWV